MKKTNQKGFTLIEILVVIAILGILSVVTIVALDPVKRFQDARNSRRREDVNAILQAVSMYSIDNDGAFPTLSSSALPTMTVTSSAITCTDCDASNLDGLGTYLSEIPVDPDGATEYQVGTDAAGTHVIVATDAMEVNDDQADAVFYLTY